MIHLLLHAVVGVGETAITPLTEETQLESLGLRCLLKHTNTHREGTNSATLCL